MEELRRTSHGKLPTPDCRITFGLLGADSSGCTAQRGVPRPVTPCSHPEGRDPAASVSKLKVSAWTELIGTPVVSATTDDQNILFASMSAPWQSLDAVGVLRGGSATPPIGHSMPIGP